MAPLEAELRRDYFRKDPCSKIIVVDRSKKALRKISQLPVEFEVCNGTLYLEQFLSKGRKTDYIIPSVPFHLAFEFTLSQSKPWGGKRIEAPSLSGLPNPMIGKTGDLYTSLADFLCPEDCPEPAQYYSVTKQRRPKPLYRILEDMKGRFESCVIRSRQLAPGVGGYSPEALLDLFENIKKRIEPGRTILISTSCRCHGVTSALTFSETREPRALGLIHSSQAKIGLSRFHATLVPWRPRKVQVYSTLNLTSFITFPSESVISTFQSPFSPLKFLYA